MKQYLIAGVVAIAALGAAAAGANAAPTCTPTTFTYQGGGPLTAALVDPPGTVSGEVDASAAAFSDGPCDIGIYFDSGSHTVQNADVHGARQFGIVNNGANVNMYNDTIHEIGDVPLSGNQYGIGIYYAAGSAATGNAIANTLWNYQKNGIEVRGPSAHNINIQYNIVEGIGPTTGAAQNGIEVGFGATNIQVQNNISTGHSYIGPNDATGAGILIFGGAGYGGPNQMNVTVQNNSSIANDVGISFSNIRDSSSDPVTTPTNNKALNNTMWNNTLYNTTGSVTPAGDPYQAGVQDQGDQDTIKDNNICGPGYTPGAFPSPAQLHHIDVTMAINPKIKGNACNGNAVGSDATGAHAMKKASP